jgi:hypothetical protein
MERQTKHSQAEQHDIVKQKYDDVQSDGRYEEGMARMALYHQHCQDPVIFRTLGDIRGSHCWIWLAATASIRADSEPNARPTL